MKILFVCRGNVGRSQMAEALFIKLAGGKAEAVSAGIKLSGPEQPIGELLPQIQEVLDVMKEEGVDVSMNRRKELNEKMVEEANKVIVLIDDEKLLPDYLINSPKLIHWNLPDPKGRDILFTREVKNKIKELVEGLVKELN